MPAPLDWLARKTGLPRAELRWASWFALVVMALTCLPYLFGVLAAPAGWRYMGFLSNPDEHNVYMAWMRQAIEGRWLFKDLFTTEPQPGPGFLNILFLTLGWVARVLHVEPIWPYHAARLAFGFLLLLTAYIFAARFCQSVLARRLAVALIAFSSGFGWLYMLLRPAATVHPIDFGVHRVLPEAITFLTILLNPLFTASVWLILLTYLLLLRAWDTGSGKALVGASLAAFFLANIHTYDVLVIYCVLAAHLLVQGISRRRPPWREAAMAAVVVAVSVWPVLQQYALVQHDVVFRAKALTPKLTPPGRYVALGFGLPLLLAVPGALVGLASRRALLPVVWVVANWLLIAYAPFSFQRKMIEGMQIPICLLAAAFVGDWWLSRGGPLWPPREPTEGLPYEVARKRRAAAIALGLVLLTIPSNAFFVRRVGHDLLTNNRDYLYVLMPPLYLTDDEFAAMLWLGTHTRPRDAVLSTNLVGSYIPGVAGNTVYVGHWDETINYPRKLGRLQDFFDPDTPDAARIAFMRRHRLRYLFYSQYERALGGFDPNAAPWLERAYRRGGVTIFRLPPQAPARQSQP